MLRTGVSGTAGSSVGKGFSVETKLQEMLAVTNTKSIKIFKNELCFVIEKTLSLILKDVKITGQL